MNIRRLLRPSPSTRAPRNVRLVRLEKIPISISDVLAFWHKPCFHKTAVKETEAGPGGSDVPPITRPAGPGQSCQDDRPPHVTRRKTCPALPIRPSRKATRTRILE